jgi:adenylate cyclase class 2
MSREIEWRYEIKDESLIQSRLVAYQGEHIGRYLMPIIVYNSPTSELYVRVRHEGTKITFTIKRDLEAEFPIEHEISVKPTEKNLETLHAMCLSLGCTVKYRVDKIRDIWNIRDTEVVFDTYPGVPTYVEIEAHDIGKLSRVEALLGLTKQQRIESRDIYNHFYGIPCDRVIPPNYRLTFNESAKTQFAGKFKRNEAEFDRLLRQQIILYNTL